MIRHLKALFGAPVLPVHPDAGGEDRKLGNVFDPKAPRRYLAPRMGDTIPDAQWSAVSDPYYPGMPIYDQDGKGACNAFASIEALECARAMAGYPYIPLSAWFLYGKLTKGFDVGSNPEDALNFLTQTGTCQDTLVPYGVMSPLRFSAQANQDAANWRIEVGNAIGSFEELATAILLRLPCVITMAVGSGYNTLDADGCVHTGWGYDNHALSTTGRLKRCGNGDWAVEFRNHWTKQWGNSGLAFVRRSSLFRNQSAAAYSIQIPKGRPEDEPAPPVLA